MIVCVLIRMSSYKYLEGRQGASRKRANRYVCNIRNICNICNINYLTSIEDSQVVTMKQLREIVDYMNNNTQALDNKVNEIGITKVKLPSIKCFNSTRLKLKRFLLQIKFKVI